VLHLEGGNYGICMQPEDIDQLKVSVGGVVKLIGKLLSQIARSHLKLCISF